LETDDIRVARRDDDGWALLAAVPEDATRSPTLPLATHSKR